MKKVYFKTSAIISGQVITDGDVELYNYKFRKNIINRNLINNKGLSIGKYKYEPIQFFFGCLKTENDNILSYETIEQIKPTELLVSNKTNFHNSKELLSKYPQLLKGIINVEKYIRLLFNIPIFFREIIIDIKDENDVPLTNGIAYLRNNSFFPWSYPDIDINIFLNNVRLKMDESYFDNLNIKAERALELYSSSFETENHSVRFTLMMSSIEALFCNNNKKGIEEKICNCSSYLLYSTDETKRRQLFDEIKRLYGLRSRYIHGNVKAKIEKEDESSLRDITRKVILSYIIYASNTKLTPNSITKALIDNIPINLSTRLFIVAINAKNFEEQQKKLIEEIEKDIGHIIPAETKNKILRKAIRQS